MSTPVITFRIDEHASRLTLAQRIARSIAADIRRGRLAPGARLPGSRRLAEQLGVHRNTVLAAFVELERQGYLLTEPARGTFVAAHVPELDPGHRPAQGPRVVELPVNSKLPPLRADGLGPGVLPLVGGLPDLRLVPHASLARAYRAALKDTQCLDYQDELGDLRLRRALVELLAQTRGVRASPDSVMITRGSQMALHLAGLALSRPGAAFAVEELGYRPAWEALKLSGLQAIPMPVDRDGLCVDQLEAVCEQRDIAGVYVTPHHQYPTTVTLSAARRIALLRLAARRRLAILEDDYDHEVQFEGRPVLPLASADDASVVVYIGTFSKVLAPGLRLGYVVAQPRVIEAMRRFRTYLDRQGDHAVERALAYFIEDGELEAHVRRTRREYQARRHALMAALRSELGESLEFREPQGGLALWARVFGPKGRGRRGTIRYSEDWARAALRAGVLVQPARSFTFDHRGRAYFRLGYARLNATELGRAVAAFAGTRPRA